MPSLAEDRVKQLAKLKSNTTCPNCGYTKKFGFSTVCIKFFTFVCNECKTSHQAISHRCKSLTMSSWTNEEVDALAKNGNTMARRTWLKNAPPEGTGGRPSHGMDINVYKRFIVEVYEHKRYYGELDPNDGMGQQEPAQQPNAAAAARRQPSNAAAARVKKPAVRPQMAAPVQPVAPPAPAPVADLLDFGSAPATTVTSAPASGNADLFSADFGAFQAPAPAAPPCPVANGFDAFGMGAPAKSTPAPAAAAADPFSFDAFGNAASSNNNTSSNNSKPTKTPTVVAASSDPFDFGGFGSSLPSSSAAPAPSLNTMNNSGGGKKPIMGGASATGNANAISMMAGAPPTAQSGMRNKGNPMMSGMNGMGSGMNNMGSGMNMNNMMNPQMMAMMQQQQMMMGNNNMMGGGMNPNMNMMNPQMMMMQQPNGMMMGSNNMQNMMQSNMGMMNMNAAMINDQQRMMQMMMQQQQQQNKKK